MRRTRSMWRPVRDEHRLVEIALAEHRADRPQRLERRPALSSTRIAAPARRGRSRRPGRGVGLGRRVALGLAAGHDEVRRIPVVVELDGMVEPGLRRSATGRRCTGPRRGRRSRPRAAARRDRPGPRSATSCSRGRATAGEARQADGEVRSRSSGAAGRRRDGDGPVSGRGTSCTSGRIRTSRGRCARSARRSG